MRKFNQNDRKYSFHVPLGGGEGMTEEFDDFEDDEDRDDDDDNDSETDDD